MKKELGKINLLFISFAAIFGSGWLFAPLYAAQMAGPASLLAWFIGAIISAVIGITMAEVITLYPRAGGLNSVAQLTHGPLLGLYIVIFNLLVFIILPAIEVRAVLQYISSHPQYSDLMRSEGNLTVKGYLFSFILLFLINAVNLYGAKMTAWVTSVSVVFKIVTPILICGSFFYVVSASHGIGRIGFESFLPLRWDQIFQAIATSGIIFSFNGFNQATIFAGEAKNPQRTIPFAILGSLAFSGALYIFIQYVFLISIPQESLVNGWSKLSFPGDGGPFAGIAVLLGLNWILGVIYADAVISPMGTAFSYASAAPRLFYSVSESMGVFPKLKKLNRHGVPTYAIVMTALAEIIVFVLLPSLKAMIAILVAAFVLCYTVAPASLLTLRETDSDAPRQFRVPQVKLMSYLSLLFSNLMVLSCGWSALRNLLILTGVFLIASVVVAITSRKRKIFSDIRGSEWFLIQIIGMGVLSYLRDHQKVDFTYSGVAVAVLSGFVLILSQKTRIQRKVRI